MKLSVKLLYLYLFSFIGLFFSIVGSIRLVELFFKVYVFPGADTYEYAKPLLPESETAVNPEEEMAIQLRETKRQRQREASGSLAMIIVGAPLYLYHWSRVKKEDK